MRNLLEIEIGEVWVEGEVSNLRKQASGHCYFTLKDEGAQVSCVLFRGHSSRAKAQPENGMQVRVFGEVSVYESRGQLQMIIKQVEDAGLGDLQARFEALKKKLNTEGLFDEEHKKPLPKFPVSVGLVTSPTGAALQDMLNILERRAPWVQPVLYPVQVQGTGAEHGIAEAIKQWGNAEKNNLPQVDVIIIGRGGGSLEDLWNFNEEVVARAIFDCPVPVISAVGHEIDFSIADFVADMRAPTPSAAAELVVPDGGELKSHLVQLSARMNRLLDARLKHDTAILKLARRSLMHRDAESTLRDPILEVDRLRAEMEQVATTELERRSSQIRKCSVVHGAHRPERVMAIRAEKLIFLRSKLKASEQGQIKQFQQRVSSLASMLRALGPEATFSRGFSIAINQKGMIIREANALKAGDLVETQFSKGKILSKVE